MYGAEGMKRRKNIYFILASNFTFNRIYKPLALKNSSEFWQFWSLELGKNLNFGLKFLKRRWSYIETSLAAWPYVRLQLIKLYQNKAKIIILGPILNIEIAMNNSKLHSEMIALLTKFRDEEQQHHDIGLEEGAEKAPAFQILKFAIKDSVARVSKLLLWKLRYIKIQNFAARNYSIHRYLWLWKRSFKRLWYPIHSLLITILE